MRLHGPGIWNWQAGSSWMLGELDYLERAVCIELDASKHALGMDSLNRARNNAGTYNEKITSTVCLCCGDMFDFNISTATHVYIASLCFTNEMMQGLATKLRNEAPHLQQVATLTIPT
jgi:hypothetical protein